ncbi:unnamed protein product, partial [Urochloa humidicola]
NKSLTPGPRAEGSRAARHAHAAPRGILFAALLAHVAYLLLLRAAVRGTRLRFHTADWIVEEGRTF